MRILTTAACLLLAGLSLRAENAEQIESKDKPSSPPRISSGTTQQPGPAAPAAAPNDQQSLDELTHRVRKLELEMLQKSLEPKDSGAVIAALAAMGVGILALIGQFFLALREDRRSSANAERALELARQEALFRQNEKLLDFRLKQMEQFYAPMRALLKQTGGLYDKMRIQLLQDEPGRYRWTPNPDPKRRNFQVRQGDGTWHDFRLLDQFPAVKKDSKALALADQILTIGKEMTAIVTQHAGLAAGDLLDLLGQYMSHYAILSAIRQEERTEPYPPGSHEMGYYPLELDARIADGYREIAEIIADSAKESSRLIDKMSGSEGAK